MHRHRSLTIHVTRLPRGLTTLQHTTELICQNLTVFPMWKLSWSSLAGGKAPGTELENRSPFIVAGSLRQGTCSSVVPPQALMGAGLLAARTWLLSSDNANAFAKKTLPTAGGLRQIRASV